MKILFHVGVGNTDRPARWDFINGLYSDLARTLEKLGHDCLVWYHPKAKHKNIYKNNLCSEDVYLTKDQLKEYNWVFTWNGTSDGDVKLIEKVGLERMIYGELGFFDHYSTCQFDFSGVNAKSENLIQLIPFIEDNNIIKTLQDKYKKPNSFPNKPYVFVALQDERDSNIVKYSPFKKMEEVLDYVQSIYINSDINILYKKHPHYTVAIKARKNFIEVTGDVHSYIPYAENVIGINSSVLLEAYLYHSNVLTLGLGLSSRQFRSDHMRESYIAHLNNKQHYWAELKDVNIMRESYLYKTMIAK